MNIEITIITPAYNPDNLELITFELLDVLNIHIRCKILLDKFIRFKND